MPKERPDGTWEGGLEGQAAVTRALPALERAGRAGAWWKPGVRSEESGEWPAGVGDAGGGRQRRRRVWRGRRVVCSRRRRCCRWLEGPEVARDVAGGGPMAVVGLGFERRKKT